MRPFYYRTEFQKRGPAGYLSHRESLLMLGRSLIRTGLPLHLSGGRKWPNPRITILHPLPTGVESLREIAIFGLLEFLPPEELDQILDPAMAGRLDYLKSIPTSGPGSPSIQSMTFRIEFQEPLNQALVDWSRHRIPPGENPQSQPSSESEEWISGVRNFTIADRQLTYAVQTDKQILHPNTLMKKLQERSEYSLPIVERIVKTDVTLKENN